MVEESNADTISPLEQRAQAQFLADPQKLDMQNSMTNTETDIDTENMIYNTHTLQRKASMLCGMISIRDFAYSIDHSLHHGVLSHQNDYTHPIMMDEEDEEDEDEDYDDYENSYDYYNSYQDDDDRDEEDEEEDSYNDGSNDSSHTGEYTSKRSVRHERGEQLDDNNDEEDDDDEEGAELQAVALYGFSPENENELALVPGDIVIINYDYGDGWLVAYDPTTEKTGFVPDSYVHIVNNEEELQEILRELEMNDEDEVEENEGADAEAKGDDEGVGEYEGDLVAEDEIATARPFLPGILQNDNSLASGPVEQDLDDSDWVDEEEDEIEDGDEESNLESQNPEELANKIKDVSLN